jgi:tyrosyl-tRNA synthetase
MSIPDTMIAKYYRLASTLSVDEVDAIEAELAAGTANPYALKRALAANIVDLYHGEGAGAAASDEYDRIFKEGGTPDDIPTVAVELEVNEAGMVYVPAVLVAAGLAKGTGEARRLIDGGGVKVAGVALEQGTYEVAPSAIEGALLQVGKKKYAQLA